MKNFFLLLLLIGIQFGLSAQDGSQKDFQTKGAEAPKGMQVSVNESMQLMGSVSQNALTMAISGASVKKCETVWKEYAKDFRAKAKKDRKTGLYLSEGANLDDISKNPMDVYAQFERGGTGTIVSVWFNASGGYIASETNEEAYGEAVELMKDYANAVGKSMAEDNVEEQEKVLKEMEKQLKKLEKDNDRYHQKIEEAKALIAEMEDNIKQNLRDQEAKQKEMEQQEGVIEKAKDKVGEFN